jgi:hypothetical protein
MNALQHTAAELRAWSAEYIWNEEIRIIMRRMNRKNICNYWITAYDAFSKRMADLLLVNPYGCDDFQILRVLG